MKKVLLALSLFILVGCSNAKEETLRNTSNSTTENSAEEQPIARKGYLDLDEKFILNTTKKITEDDFSFTKEYSHEDVVTKTYQNESNSLKLVTYFNKGDEKPFGVLFFMDKDSSMDKVALDISDGLASRLDGSQNEYNLFANEELGDGRRVIGFKVVDSGETFSLYKDLNKNDFLSDSTRRNEVKGLIKSQKYDKLYKMTSDYIASNKPNDNDFSYDIKNYLDSNKDIYSSLSTNYDEVEDKTEVYFKNDNPISSDNNIRVYLDDDGAFTYDIGFQNDDWIFFNKSILHGDNDFTIESYDKSTSRDVLNGGVVEEKSTNHKFNDVYSDKLSEMKNGTVRFKGKDKQLDKELTEENIEAINELSKISGMKRILSNLVYSYENQ